MSEAHRNSEWTPNDRDLAEIALSTRFLELCVELSEKQWDDICVMECPMITREVRKRRRMKRKHINPTGDFFRARATE